MYCPTSSIDPGFDGWQECEVAPIQLDDLARVIVFEKAEASLILPTEPTTSTTTKTLIELSLEITDANGQQLESVQAGDEVQLRVIGRDLRDDAKGIFSAYFDIEYPPGFVPAGEIKLDDFLVNVRSGAHTKPGLIDELGGFGGMDYQKI